MQQAFVSVSLNHAGSTYLDFGKWVTPTGAELIEARDNWLYSRDLLFTWAIPFSHAGVRVYHYTSDTDYVMVHLNRDWNAVGDSGGSSCTGVTVNRALAKGWTITGNYLGGEEPALDGEGTLTLRLIVAF